MKKNLLILGLVLCSIWIGLFVWQENSSAQSAEINCSAQLNLGSDVYGGTANRGAGYQLIKPTLTGTDCPKDKIQVIASIPGEENIARGESIYGLDGELGKLQLRVVGPAASNDVRCKGVPKQDITVSAVSNGVVLGTAPTKLEISECLLEFSEVSLSKTID